MRKKSLCLLALVLPCILLGCSKHPAGQTASPGADNADSSSSAGPAQAAQTSGSAGDDTLTVPIASFQPIQTDEEKEHARIQGQASALAAAGNLAGVETLAAQYRASKECFPDGTWKLSDVCAALRIPREAPDASWTRVIGVLNQWVKARPKSSTARVALAGALTEYAWKARGTGVASTVTDAGGRLFEQRLTLASQVLEAAHTLPEQCPHSWEVLFSVALGLNADKATYQKIFAQAVAAEPDDEIYYASMANYLTEHWHGQPGELAAFVTALADKIGGEEGDLLYARIAWSLDAGSTNIFAEAHLSVDRVDQGFQVMEKRYPDSLRVKNGHAYMMAFGSSNARLRRKLLNALDGKFAPSVWGSKQSMLRWTQDL